MKQITHSWIAIRAIDLVRRDPRTRNLAKILTPWVKHSYIGCWLPDMTGFKKGHGYTKNHTFKMAPYSSDDTNRFILKKNDLLKELDSNTDLYKYLKNECTLPTTWWDRSFKAEQPDGRHLPDCLSSIFDTILDLILLGNKEVDDLVPGPINYSKYLTKKISLSKEQISTFFFMLSHYVSDCFMPCHCDNRDLASFKNNIHKQWEIHWDRIVGNYFSKKELLKTSDSDEKIIEKTKEVDTKLGLDFKLPITFDKSDDIWKISIFWCRGSFAFSSDLFKENNFSYTGNETPKFGEHFNDKHKLKGYDRVILQSAVYSVASMWKKIWRKFKD